MKYTQPPIKTHLTCCIVMAALFMTQCTHPTQLSGGGSDTEVSGRILAADGTAKAGMRVVLIAESYDPAFDGNLPSKMFDTTDTNGTYHFDSLNKGIYNVQAANPNDGTKLLLNSITVDSGKTTLVPEETLKKTATLMIVLPDSLLTATGIITIPGTLLSKSFSGGNGVFEMDSVPQGTLQSIQFKKTITDTTVLFTNVLIASSDTIFLNPFNTISGTIVASDGRPIADASVTLIPSGYNPAFDAPLPSKYQVVSNNTGGYEFYNIEQGVYNVYKAKADGLKSLVDSIIVGPSPLTQLPYDTLKKTATLIVWLPDSLVKYSGYLSIPGTFLWKPVQLNTRSVEFDSVPQGTLTSIVFQQTSAAPALALYRNVVIASSDTVVLNSGLVWAHQAKVMLNTTASGGNIGQNVINFPMLVRLNSVNFNFSQAKPNGEDLRFLKQDNSALAFEIEYWDSATSTATIWVKTDTVFGNNNSQYFFMLWGSPNAKTNSTPAAVFDTSNGFQGVWHLGESGGAIQKDATVNHFDGTPTAMTGSSDVTGIIGRGIDFDGSSQCLTVLNARNSRLDVQTDSFYTVSSWVYARTLNKGLHVFLSKGSAQYGLMINKLDSWEFYGGLKGYGVDTTTSAPVTANVWTLVTGVRSGMKQYLYVNGALADSTMSAAGTSPGISNNFYDLVIGRQSDDQSQWFDGIIDESSVSNRARTSAWIKLCYQNQRSVQNVLQIVPIK